MKITNHNLLSVRFKQFNECTHSWAQLTLGVQYVSVCERMNCPCGALLCYMLMMLKHNNNIMTPTKSEPSESTNTQILSGLGMRSAWAYPMRMPFRRAGRASGARWRSVGSVWGSTCWGSQCRVWFSEGSGRRCLNLRAVENLFRHVVGRWEGVREGWVLRRLWWNSREMFTGSIACDNVGKRKICYL